MSNIIKSPVKQLLLSSSVVYAADIDDAVTDSQNLVTSRAIYDVLTELSNNVINKINEER